LVKYKHDAWGKCNTVFLDESATEIANFNPFRYRSYYFNTKTNLYFLKTRYYDPEVGRFTTIDDISYLDPDSINGLNLYAYCLNNPLKYIDHFGCSVTLTILAIIGISALIGAAFGALGGVMSGAIKPASIVAKELGRTFEKQLIKILQYQVIKKIVPSLFENLLSDFTSWYTEFVVDNTFQRVFE